MSHPDHVVVSQEEDVSFLLREDDCHSIVNSTEMLLESFAFWTDGVLKCLLALLGIVGNVFATVILLRPAMRNSFNLLVVSLATVDNSYLVGSVLESFRQRFLWTNDVHTILFPYLLYPMNKIVMTASIFLTVAIALERYVAVHYPIDYNSAMNDPSIMRRRLLRYLIPVILLSVIFNVTKFLEGAIYYEDDDNAAAVAAEDAHPVDEGTTGRHWRPRLTVTELRTHPVYSAYANWSRLVVLGIIPFGLLVFLNGKIYVDIQSRRTRRSEALARGHFTRRPTSSSSVGGGGVVVLVRDDDCSSQVVDGVDNNDGHQLRPQQQPQQQQQQQQQQQPPQESQREKRRRAEDNLAVVFMGIILMFMVCHLPRILIDVHELFTLDQANLCMEAGFGGIPAWAIVAIHVSHLMLVINSATNILVYCGISSKFREEIAKALMRRTASTSMNES